MELSHFNQQRWQSIMKRQSIGDNVDSWLALNHHYQQSHRFYHTAEHIDDCLRILDSIIPQPSDSEIIELALWFHDAIYLPARNDNENASANWTKRFCIENGISDIAERVYNMILSTADYAPSQDETTNYLLDIDMSILGQDKARYDAYSRNIRLEYSHVSDNLFKIGRTRILQAFLDMPHIFHTHYFQHRFEAQARKNLTREFTDLSNL